MSVLNGSDVDFNDDDSKFVHQAKILMNAAGY